MAESYPLISSYCRYVSDRELSDVHRRYHDNQYGYPIDDDDELFGRLILEINQAGLSWTTILNKQESFRKAYHNFSIRKIANYKEKDINRLLEDSGVIRNRLKITAAIFNAQQVLVLQKDFGSFKKFLDHHSALQLDQWVKLFKSQFRFTGGEIVKEFLMSTAYLPGAHDASCPVFKKIRRTYPFDKKL